MTLLCRFECEIPPVATLRLKLQANERERFAVLGLARKRVPIGNP